MTSASHICKNCGNTGVENYCSHCGQKFITGKITVSSILLEISHYFTHLDKGFGYTLKELATHPGAMQKEYIAGRRSRHQKPFSMFFLCGTICGLVVYLLSLFYRQTHGTANTGDEDFFRHYFTLIQALLLPVYTLFLWLLFIQSGYNFAEILVLTLYMLSFVFLAIIPITALTFLIPRLDASYLVLAFMLVYNSLTNIYFFKGNRWMVIGKSILMLSIGYLCFVFASQLFLTNIKQ